MSCFSTGENKASTFACVGILLACLVKTTGSISLGTSSIGSEPWVHVPGPAVTVIVMRVRSGRVRSTVSSPTKTVWSDGYGATSVPVGRPVTTSFVTEIASITDVVARRGSFYMS